VSPLALAINVKEGRFRPACRNHNGRIALEDLNALLELCRARARSYQSFECEAMLRGYCTLQMWRAMSGCDGLQTFRSW
jgi:hypothetical protein